MRQYTLLVIIIFFSFSCSEKDAPSAGRDRLFSLLEASETGIDFVNHVSDQENFNILVYRNFYNGGGVAIGDINNDGLDDIYFTANMGGNKLFLNEGAWKFKDISEQAGVTGTKDWSTGVAMVDVNRDGLLDIYVCNSGLQKGKARSNELFINNGDLTFTESAEKWGLNSDAMSVHATFFDYDSDGDLDCFLLNNSFTTPSDRSLYQISRDQQGEAGGDKLFRNEGDFFVDVTDRAGIYSSNLGFGLGVSVGDLNNDMLPDLYVSNDFWERDYLYINKGDGSFSEELEKRTTVSSMNSMGADIGDINNDGFPEVFSTDMMPATNYRIKSMTQFDTYEAAENKFNQGYYRQSLQNCLQLNDGRGNFTEVAWMYNVAASDWSWGALIFDFDLDGWNDIYVSNGVLRDLTDFGFVSFISDRQKVDDIVNSTGRSDFRDFLEYMPATKVPNSAFMNNKNNRFSNSSSDIGLNTPSHSNGAAYGDLDNDGDLDLVVNNINMGAFVYRNNMVGAGANKFLKVSFQGPKKNPLGIGARATIFKGDSKQTKQHFLSRGFQSSVSPGLVFGIAGVDAIDSMVVVWPDKKMQVLKDLKANTTIKVDYSSSEGTFSFPTNTSGSFFENITSTIFDNAPKHIENQFDDFRYESLILRKLSEEGPAIAVGDVNGDGTDDFLITGAAGDPAKLFIQSKKGHFMVSEQPAFVADSSLEGTCAAFYDADMDGDLDLLVGHGGNEFNKGVENFKMRFYENDGKGNFELNVPKTPPIAGNFSCIRPHDFDKDGDVDLFIGARNVPGNYGLIPGSFLLGNRGDGTWDNLTTEDYGRLGMVTDAVWSDTDGDNDQDLVVVGDWMPVTVFENREGNMERKMPVKGTEGWWTSIKASDLDNDGDDDFVIGNWGLNTKFKTSPERPLKMYVRDFDKNGKKEPIILWTPPEDSILYPFASKQDIEKQLPVFRSKEWEHKRYSNATYEELFSGAGNDRALVYKAPVLSSVILWNHEKGYELEQLPDVAQATYISDLIIDDFDADGIKDIVLFGGQSGLKPDVGALSAKYGIFLRGDGEKGFHPVIQAGSGLAVSGTVKDAVILKDSKGVKFMLLGRNNAEVMVFKITGK